MRKAGSKNGDIETLELGDVVFDRIFSVHCIYFWDDMEAVLGKLAGALRPGGKLLLAFRPEGEDIPARFREPTYRFPRKDDVVNALGRFGLQVSCSVHGSPPQVLFVEGTAP